MVPTAQDLITFTVEGPGSIVATDNGDATDQTVFAWPQRKAFNGLALAIVRPVQNGYIAVHATATGLKPAETRIVAGDE